MPTFIEQTREVVIPNNGSTTDRQPIINVQLSAPMGPNTSLVLYINDVPSATASVEISPTEYTFSPQCDPGTYAFRVDVIQTDGGSTVLGTNPSNVNNVVVEAINQAWSSTIDQDGPYAVGNSGSSDPFATFEFTTTFWIAALGNLKGTDIVEWQTTWTPGSDGWNPPSTIVHPADATNPWRLEVQAHSGDLMGYSSGVLEVELLINGIVQEDKLQLVLSDDPYGYEGATWSVWTAPTL